MTAYNRPDATFPAIAENGDRAPMSAQEVGEGWSTTSQSRPPADKFNERDFLNSSGVKYLCQLGIAEYDPNEQYQGKGLVIASNGSVYWNMSPCKGVDPTAGYTQFWEKTAVRAQDAIDIVSGLDIVAGYLTVAQAYQLFVNYEWWNSPEGAPANDNQIWQMLHTIDGHVGNAFTQISNTSNSLAELWELYNNTRLWTLDAENNRFPAIGNQISELYGRTDINRFRIDGLQQQIDDISLRLNNLLEGEGSTHNGWRRLRSGGPLGDVMMQWRSDYSHDNLPGGWTQTNRWVEFPTPFPTTCWSVQVTTGRAGGQNNQIGAYQVQPSQWTNGGCNLTIVNRGDMSAMELWPIIFAIGN